MKNSVIEVTNNDSIYEELNLQDQKEIRRMGTFWLCLICQGSHQRAEKKLSPPMFKKTEVDGVNILFPSSVVENQEYEYNAETLICVPKRAISNSNQRESLSPYIYSHEPISNSFLSTLYKIREAKFNSRRFYSEIYDGDILNLNLKKVGSMVKVVDDSCIRLSDSWKNNQRRSIYSQFQQYGNTALTISISVDINCIETIATAMICSGRVVSLEFVGNTNNEFSTKYFLHQHDNTQECSSNCVKTEIIFTNQHLESKYFPIFLCITSQKQHSFIEQFLKNVNFECFCEDFYITVDFNVDGTARINGILWSYYCTEFSKLLASSSLTGEAVDTSEFLNYIENTIFTACKKEEIKRLLNTCEEDAKLISELVSKYQNHQNIPCDQLALPSLETMMTCQPDEACSGNLYVSKKFINFCRQKLLTLSNDERSNLSTLDWLAMLRRLAKFRMIEDEKLELTFEDQILEFQTEKRLEELITTYGAFSGVYQFCISCSSREYSVILKRPTISECFIVPYNPTLLKAFTNRIELLPVNSEIEYWDINEKYNPELPNVENTEVSQLLSEHSLMSIVEFLALSDTKRVCDISPTSTIFIPTYEDTKAKFRKVPTKTDETFECPGKGHFLQLSNNVFRHRERLNGKQLLLVETGKPLIITMVSYFRL